MKVLIYIFVIFYIIYVVNKFLGRFYFQKFTHAQNDIFEEMMRKQKQESTKRPTGDIHVENLKSAQHSKKSSSQNDGEYIDYEIVK
ncbi:MAG: DUF4834 family protein [Cytophagales bacterium]